LANLPISSNKDFLDYKGDYLRQSIDYFMHHSIQLEFKKLNDALLIPFVYYLIDRFDLFIHSEGKEYLLKYLDILNEFSLLKSNSIIEFLAYYEDNKASFFIASPDHLDSITISSIHKSKGLEYPIVIIPFASWSHQVSFEKIWYELNDVKFDELAASEQKSLTYFYSKVNAKEIKGFDHLSLQSQMEKEAVFLDALNMLYVAATRARLHLHFIVSKPSDDAHGTTKSIFNVSVGDILCKMAEKEGQLIVNDSYLAKNQYFDLIAHFVFNEQQIPECIHNPKRQEQLNKQVGIRSKLFQMPKFRIDSSKSDMFTLVDKKKQKGNVLHDFLAQLKGISHFELNINTAISFDYMDDILDILQDAKIREFFIDDEVLFVENDILCPDGSIFRPDRVIQKEGVVHIIDFKSGKRKEEHHEQLRNYCSILHRMGYVNPQGVLIYLTEKEVEYV
jgi:ATP-dependent exoDNAse (exonuclease V) beta subunit